MTESVQKKLLRVRPPRVKITYDVETGGAIEKKELPFIVGILADLKGEREDPANYESLKTRNMVDIDRDNFNDVMATIKPRVVLNKAKEADPTLKALLKDAADLELTFANIDAFEPLAVIQALPSVRAVYGARSQIRDLQAKAESNDVVAKILDDLVEPLNPGNDANPALSNAAAEQAAKDIAAALKLEEDKIALSMTAFKEQLNTYFNDSNAAVASAISNARQRGTTAVIDELVALIDDMLSKALSAIMHSAGFKQMEATWRGLQYLVFNTETGPMLKLKVFNATKDELRKDMLKAVEFDQSRLFKLIYEAEYGTYGGHPYSLLVGDYAIGHTGADIDFLKKMAEVAAAAHAPFIAQASEELFGLSGFDKLDKPRDLKKIFEGGDLIQWQAFREMEDARYVTLALPRALLRLPYGAPTKRNTTHCEALNFNEQVSNAAEPIVFGPNGEPVSYANPDADHFLWGNPAFLLAERITNAFSLYNWTAAIRGVEGGGLVEGLPVYTFTSANGSTELFCPTEVSITDRREKELNDLGFISLCHCKGTGKAAFFGGQTTNLPKKYFSDNANANAKISAMLPYMLAASRFAHYIKVIMREKIGSFLTRGNVESYLNTWISNYVLLDDNASQEAKASYPLREANVVVTDVPGEPGSYRATVFLKPHFQLEELTTSIRLVANLPK
ncbi:type VI secretion system contractile sheath large subunit [Massilia sp. W12]|uniref:type VI secretion system contractile sheath large subunit n=1 Tax=Massilia sp. W12 TaxID=3126507 RepID=UPI0030D11FA3